MTDHTHAGAPRAQPDLRIPTTPRGELALWADDTTVHLRRHIYPRPMFGVADPPHWGPVIRLPRDQLEQLLAHTEPISWEKLRKHRPDEIGIDDVITLSNGAFSNRELPQSIVLGPDRWYLLLTDDGRHVYRRGDLITELDGDHSVRT